MKPHKHCELIKAWADGAQIEVYTLEGWELTQTPNWFNNGEYRIKPERKRYRVGKIKAGDAIIIAGENEQTLWESHQTFDHWISDWIEYD